MLKHFSFFLEICAVFIYMLFPFCSWYQQSSATTANGNHLDALENIREFYAFVLNAVSLNW